MIASHLLPAFVLPKGFPGCGRGVAGPGAVDEILCAVTLEERTPEGQFCLDSAQPLRGEDTLKSPRSLYMQNCREILEIDVGNSYFKMEQLSAWGTPPGGHVSTGLGFCPEVDWCIQDSNNLLNVLDGYFRSWKLLGK